MKYVVDGLDTEYLLKSGFGSDLQRSICSSAIRYFEETDQVKVSKDPAASTLVLARVFAQHGMELSRLARCWPS